MAQLTRPEAVTLALHALGGAEHAVDTEDIALRAAEVSPGMFSWQKYPEHVDKEIVRVALSDARLKKRYVVGSHSKGGWMLTPEGQEFARQNARLLEEPPEHRRRGKDEHQESRERARLLTSDAFARFQDGGAGTLTDDEADAFFRLNIYVRGQARERKIARVENQFASDPQLGELVGLLAARARERK